MAGVIALVAGSAACLVGDLRLAGELVRPDVVVAVNAAARVVLGTRVHLATQHPGVATNWIAARLVGGLPPLDGLWCPQGAAERSVLPWRHAPAWGGSSGLFGVSVALELGADRVILCGVPMDHQPHFDDEKPWTEAGRYRYAWTHRRDQLRRSVRSCSGWTRGLLGAPDAAWLGVSEAPAEAVRK